MFSFCRAVQQRAKDISSPCPAWQWGAGTALGAERRQNQVSWPRLAKAMSHTIMVWCSETKLEEMAGELPLLRNSLGIGQKVVSNCSVHHSFDKGKLARFFVFFFSSSHLFSKYTRIYYDFPFLFCLDKLSLSQSKSFTFFSYSSPSHLGTVSIL